MWLLSKLIKIMPNTYSEYIVCKHDLKHLHPLAYLIFIKNPPRGRTEAQIHDVIATVTLFSQAISEAGQTMSVPFLRQRTEA